jgi:hypothetical protein
MSENDVLALLIVAWLLVTLTRTVLDYRKSQRAADRKAAKENPR